MTEENTGKTKTATQLLLWPELAEEMTSSSDVPQKPHYMTKKEIYLNLAAANIRELGAYGHIHGTAARFKEISKLEI